MEFNEKLIETFAYNNFNIEEIHRIKVNANNKGFEKTYIYPGFIFPISGSAHYTFNGTPYIAKEGSIIHGGANMDLGKEVLGDNNWEFILVLYDILLESGELDLDKLHFELKIGENPKIINKLMELVNISDDEPMSVFKRETIFRIILEEMLVVKEDEKLDHTEELFNNVSKYIKENYTDNLSVRELSEINNVSENQLFYAFTKHSKIGPGEYIIRYRLEKAKKLLLDTNLNIKQISELIGYYDSLYFSRIFKKHYGLSPMNYRKQLRNSPYKIKENTIHL